MVAQADILKANSLINDDNCPKVVVFVGGTAGIGKLTLEALVSTGCSMRIYLIGRKPSAERTAAFIKELNVVNSRAKIIWTEAEVSLLAEGQRVCEEIKSKESSVDLLFLTAGYAPMKGRESTSEGLEITQALEYYSRMQFMTLLMPLLEKAETGRVISVLGGGLERASSIKLDDLNLEKPGAFSALKSRPHVIGMVSVYMDKLAEQHPGVTFIHSWPGWVNTGNIKRSTEPNSWLAWFLWLTIEPLIYLVAMKDETAAQRYLFLSTSSHYGGRGTPWKGKAGVNAREKEHGGLFLTNYKADCTPNGKTMAGLREAARTIVWDKTQEILRPYL